MRWRAGCCLLSRARGGAIWAFSNAGWDGVAAPGANFAVGEFGEEGDAGRTRCAKHFFEGVGNFFVGLHGSPADDDPHNRASETEQGYYGKISHLRLRLDVSCRCGTAWQAQSFLDAREPRKRTFALRYTGGRNKVGHLTIFEMGRIIWRFPARGKKGELRTLAADLIPGS